MFVTDANNRLVLTHKAWADLRRINREGNEIVWTADEENWGVIEKWEFPRQMRGKLLEDCDGITLWKMNALLQAGFPNTALLFTICFTETDEGHAVLCVTTDRGDFICDNRYSDVKSYDDLRADGYRFMYRSSIGGKLEGVWDKIAEIRG